MRKPYFTIHSSTRDKHPIKIFLHVVRTSTPSEKEKRRDKYSSGSWWHSQEKGGLITSQPSHFREMLVGNTVTSGHHARIVSPNFSLEKKKKQ
jgi:hypothetical protein